MNNSYVSLCTLPLGSCGIVRELISNGDERRRMLDLGLVGNTMIKSLQKSPSGDPTAYEIRGAVIALRSEEASKVLIEKML